MTRHSDSLLFSNSSIRLLSAQVEALRGLGIIALLDSEREVKASDSDVLYIADCCKQCSNDIKTLFNLTISEKMKPIEIVQALLGKMGLKLTCVRRAQAADGRRGGLRIYQYQEPNDDRDSIFAQWQQRDQLVTEQASTALSACFDPPPDINGLNQSQSGSATARHQSETAPAASLGQRQWTPEIGSVVRLKQQVGEWVVTWVGSATTRLQQVANAWEYIAAWDELILPPPGVSS